MNPALEFLLFAAAFIALGFAIVRGVQWLTSDDIAAGVLFGKISPTEDAFHHQPDGPTPDLLACQCAQCRCVRCVDRRWLPESLVPLPVGCRVSHGLCPKCERRMHEEIEAMAPNVKLV